MMQSWDDAVLSLPACQIERDRNGAPVVRGPRVGMGADVGHAELVMVSEEPRRGSYFGPVVERAEALQYWADCGELLMSARALDDLQLKIAELDLLLMKEKPTPGLIIHRYGA